MGRSPLLLLMGCLLSPALFAAQPAEWFLQMTQKAGQQSFRGTFIYERSGIFSSHRIWHLAQGDGASRERLLQLDGPAQEVVLTNGQISCATAQLIEQWSGLQPGVGHSLDVRRLDQAYELRVLGDSRVAGRAAVALLLLPRDADRYAREMHLDAESGLPLKSLLLNDQGQLLERLQFTELKVNQAITAEQLQPVTDCQKAPQVSRAGAAQSLWQARWVPSGFVQSGFSQRPGSVSGLPVESLIFDDGMARFSVFVEPLGDAVVDTAHTQVGPTVVVARPVKTDGGTFMATVVGEIPLATAERILLSVGMNGSKEGVQ